MSISATVPATGALEMDCACGSCFSIPILIDTDLESTNFRKVCTECDRIWALRWVHSDKEFILQLHYLGDA